MFTASNSSYSDGMFSRYSALASHSDGTVSSYSSHSDELFSRSSALVSHSNGTFTSCSASTSRTNRAVESDLIEFLSIVQKCDVDYLPITW